MTKMRSIKGCGTILMSNRLFFVAHQNLDAAQAVVDELFYTHEEDRAGGEPVEGMLKEESPLLTPEEIDTLDGCVPEKMNREELTAFRGKLQATLKEMKIQERLCRERINVLRDMIDETDYAIDDLT